MIRTYLVLKVPFRVPLLISYLWNYRASCLAFSSAFTLSCLCLDWTCISTRSKTYHIFCIIPGCILSNFSSNSFHIFFCICTPSSLRTKADGLWSILTNDGNRRELVKEYSHAYFAVVQVLAMSLFCPFCSVHKCPRPLLCRSTEQLLCDQSIDSSKPFWVADNICDHSTWVYIIYDYTVSLFRYACQIR